MPHSEGNQIKRKISLFFSLSHFKIVLRFSFQQKSLSTNMFLHSCHFNSWVAKLFDVYSRFGAVFGILPYYVSGLVLSNSCSKCFIIYCLHWILCFSSNVCNRHHWDPVLRLPYCNPTSPSATEWTFATFWRNSSFQWQWHWQCQCQCQCQQQPFFVDQQNYTKQIAFIWIFSKWKQSHQL